MSCTALQFFCTKPALLPARARTSRVSSDEFCKDNYKAFEAVIMIEHQRQEKHGVRQDANFVQDECRTMQDALRKNLLDNAKD